jgi:two-component system response regulator
MAEARNRPVELRLVEDDPGDVLMTREALDEGPLPNNLSVVGNGIDAMAFLRREGQYADAPRPDLLLLDLNLPRKDGREVLAEIKSDPELRRIPVVILTTSESADDITRTYDLHANAYITKPVDFEDFARVVRAVDSFFTDLAKRPGH